MKVSVSLPAEDVAFLDDYAARQGLGSRSAALHRAVRSLRDGELAAAYEDAWAEWDAGDDRVVWEAVLADGLDPDGAA